MAEVTSSETCAQIAQSKSNAARKSRVLLESYWASVQQSGRERPLYHTFSDRYGGTEGVPYASRMHKGSTKMPNRVKDVTASSVNATLVEVDHAIANEEIEHAKEMLTHLLTFLQNWNGGLTLNELTMSVRNSSMTNEYAEHVMKTLLCWSKVHMLSKDYAEALNVLNLILEINPLCADIYALRAACYEYMSHPQEAYEEYEKYLKLETPSLLIWAHCGKCAAESHNFHAAKSYLQRVITITESYESNQIEIGNNVDREVNKEINAECVVDNDFKHFLTERNDVSLPQMSDIAFYNALAHFFLGYAHAHEAATNQAAEDETNINALCENVNTFDESNKRRELLLAESARHYRIASDSKLFVKIYEMSANDALTRCDYTLALQLLRYLQLVRPECAQYHLQTFKIHTATHKVDKQLEALSAAIDCTEEITTRNVILLARGVVEAELILNYENAIRNFSLVIESTALHKGFDSNGLTRRCLAMAYLKRAQCYLKRQRLSAHSRLERKADKDAILSDYHSFLILCDTRHDLLDSSDLQASKTADFNTNAMWVDEKHNDNSGIEEKLEVVANDHKNINTRDIENIYSNHEAAEKMELCTESVDGNSITNTTGLPVGKVAETYNTYFTELLILDDAAIIEALIALAIGAQKDGNYALATLYFSRALLSGWVPSKTIEANTAVCSKSVREEVIEFLLMKESKKYNNVSNSNINIVDTLNGASHTTDTATHNIECTSDNDSNNNNINTEKNSNTKLNNQSSDTASSINLLQLMYIAFAQHIIQVHPIAEDMFRVQYDARDFNAQGETKRIKTSEKRDGERVVQLALPCMEYSIVDEYYTEAKNKASTTELCKEEYELISLWEPYRSEVERFREEVLATRPGKRGKRHVAI